MTVDRVVSEGPGWLVIHADANGKPGPVIGYATAADGLTRNLIVRLDAGTYEFPGADVPAMVDGAMVRPGFKATKK